MNYVKEKEGKIYFAEILQAQDKKTKEENEQGSKYLSIGKKQKQICNLRKLRLKCLEKLGS